MQSCIHFGKKKEEKKLSMETLEKTLLEIQIGRKWSV